MRWLIPLLALAASPAEAAVLADGRDAVRDVLPSLGLEIVSERRAVPQAKMHSLCRSGDEQLDANGGLSVLAGRPDCQNRVTRVTGQRLSFSGRRGGSLLNDPFGFNGLGAPVLPPSRDEDAQRTDAEAETETGTEAGANVAAARGLTLPAASLTALAMPALKSAAAPSFEAAPAPTPVPPAAWLFASGAAFLILRRRGDGRGGRG